jgi:dipeptidyl-peptidase-4
MEGYNPPDTFSFTSKGGLELHGYIYRAGSAATPEIKHPTILYVYGGPGVQLVRNAYAGIVNRFC